jgi:hypothetical protein
MLQGKFVFSFYTSAKTSDRLVPGLFRVKKLGLEPAFPPSGIPVPKATGSGFHHSRKRAPLDELHLHIGSANFANSLQR